MNHMVEDDHSSVHSFSVIDDDKNNDIKVDESDTDESYHGESCKLLAHIRPKEKDQLDNVDNASFKSGLKEPLIVEVTKVKYLDSFIRVFTDTKSPKNGTRCFYHEPIVVLDHSSIVSESNELLKKDLVRFKIKMWDTGIRVKVLERLRSLPSLKNEDIHEDNVHVMPFEEVQLIVKPGSIPKSIRLLAEPYTSYRRLSKSLNFHFECDLPSIADSLADNMKKNLETILNLWKLALECRGLTLGTGAKSEDMSPKGMLKRPTWIFNVSNLPCEALESDGVIQDPLDSILPRLTGFEQDIQDLKAMTISSNSLSKETSINTRDALAAFEVKIKTFQSKSTVRKFGNSGQVNRAEEEFSLFD